VISCCASGNDFSFLSDENMFSSKWQHLKYALKISPIKGLKYLMIEGELKLT
jgi:hypothetical protein